MIIPVVVIVMNQGATIRRDQDISILYWKKTRLLKACSHVWILSPSSKFDKSNGDSDFDMRNGSGAHLAR